MKGTISATLANNQSLDDFYAEHIADYNRHRFEAFAIRVFSGNETIFTIYALDKLRLEDSNLHKGRVPVKKLNPQSCLSSIFTYFISVSSTLPNGNYDINDMEIMNK